MTREFKLQLPMRVKTSAKKLTALNLNVYRNLHHRSAHAQKKKFEDIAKVLLKDIPAMERIRLHYDVCPKSRRRLDIMNVGSIVDKYFSDCLTEYGVIPDDDYTHIDRVSFGFGGLSDEEHVLVTITELEPKKGDAMRIFLDNNDIQNALDAHIETLGITGATGVTFSLADNEGELQAEVLFGEVTTKVTVTKAAPRKNKGGRPAGSKNKPKEETPDVAVPDESSTDSGDGGTSAPTEAEAVPVTENATESEKPKAAGNSKNLFEDTPEESSNNETAPDSGEASAGSSSPAKDKLSTIFDQ